MKKTMLEVANNIDNRPTFGDVKRMIELKVERSEIQYMLQEKVSHEEMRQVLDQGRLQPSSNSKQEELSEEIRILKRKLDDAVYSMSRQQQQSPLMVQ
jgi:hypothetical protein